VSPTNSEQCKLCVNALLYIDARLLWKQAIGSNCPLISWRWDCQSVYVWSALLAQCS